MKCYTLCGIIINRPAGPAIAIPFLSSMLYDVPPLSRFVRAYLRFFKRPQFIDAITIKVHYLICVKLASQSTINNRHSMSS